MARLPIQFGEKKFTPQEFIEKIKNDPMYDYAFVRGILTAMLPVHVLRDMADHNLFDLKDMLQKREDFIADYLDFKIVKPYDVDIFERMLDYLQLIEGCSRRMLEVKGKTPGDA